MKFGKPHLALLSGTVLKIRDPDLIFPGEELAINQEAKSSSINAAIAHAKHRGAWKLGQPTSSDLKYLKGGL